MPGDEIAGLSVVVSAEVQQAMKALDGMSRQFEETSLVAQQSTEIQEASFVEVERDLKSDADAHKKHSLSIQEGLKKGGKAWVAMGAAVTGAMYGIIRTSSYGELYMTRFSSIMGQAADAVMTRYGLVGALDDVGNAFQAYVSGSKDEIEITKDAIRWWVEASGVLKVITFLMGVGFVAGIVKASAALVALVGWFPILVTAIAAINIAIWDWVLRLGEVQRGADDFSRAWMRFKTNIEDVGGLRAVGIALKEFLGHLTDLDNWVSAGFIDSIKAGLSGIWEYQAGIGESLVAGIKKHLQINPGALTADFVTNINKGIKWLDAAVKIKYVGIMDWSATFVDQIKEWGAKAWHELIDWAVAWWDALWDPDEDKINWWDLISWVGKTLWDLIVWVAKSGWDLITWVGKTLWDLLPVGVKEKWEDLVDWSATFTRQILNWGKKNWDELIRWALEDPFVGKIVKWGAKAWHELIDWLVPHFVDHIVYWGTRPWHSLIDWAVGTLWDFIVWVPKAWNDLVDWTTGSFWDFLGTAGGAAKTAWNGLVDWTTGTFWDFVTPGDNGGGGAGDDGTGDDGTGDDGTGDDGTGDGDAGDGGGEGGVNPELAAVALESVGAGAGDTDVDWNKLNDWFSMVFPTVDAFSNYYNESRQWAENAGYSWFAVGSEGLGMDKLMYFWTDNGRLIPSAWAAMNLPGYGDYPQGSYAKGGYISHDQTANVHGGEYVVPRGGTLVKEGGMPDVTINLTVNNGTQKDSRALADEISRILATEIRRLVKT